MKRRTVITSLAALAAAATARPSRAQSITKVRAYAQVSDPSGGLYYAHDLGLFEKHGLDVTITVANDSSLAVSSVISNTVDIAYTNIVSIEQAFRKGIPIVMVAPAAVNDSRTPTQWIIVPKDSPAKTMLDLQGKTIGTAPLKALGDFATNAWVDMHGGDSTKLKWVEIPYIACGPAMQQSRIDAAFVIEPYVTNLRATTRKLGWPYEAIGKHFLGAGYFASQTWASANADVVQRFAIAIAEASAWANDARNHPRSAGILEKYAHVDAETIGLMSRATYAETLVATDIQPTIDFGAKFKILDAAFPARDMIFHAS
jgi:NitT/TauT family transport system substrate-binding protein